MARSDDHIELSRADCDRISSFMSEYFNGFLVVGYDLADQGRYILNSKNVKEFRAVTSLGKDVIEIIERGDG